MKRTGSTLVVIGLLSLAAVSLVRAEEPSAVYQGLLAKYDVNKDGRLDAAEREVIRTDRLKPNPRGRSERRRFRYPDPIVARFDKDGDDELNEEEFDAARNWVDKRFKEINAEYDVNKDGRLGTDERAALSKQVQAGKFKDMGTLMGYLTRSRSSRGDRNRDMRRDEGGFSRRGILRNSDKDGDGRFSEEELAVVRATLEKVEAERVREERTGIRRVPSRQSR